MSNDATFRDRVLDFWQWFPTVAPQLAVSLESGSGLKDLDFDFVSEVRHRVGGLSWVFGPGARQGRHSFTVTGEGQRAKQMLSHFWLAQAVDVPGWDFYCSRQPSPTKQLRDLAIDVGGETVNADTLMIATEVEPDDQAVNIKAWHPTFDNLPDEARFQILYLLLDEALGEYTTQTKLGDMQIKSDPSAKPLIELPGFLDSLWSEMGWEAHSPLETYSGYGAEPSDGFDRSDTIAGYTCVPNVVVAFLNRSGALDENPIEGTGAEYLYVQIPMEVENHDDPLHYRGELEAEVSKQIEGSGYVIGGATGTNHLYIDLVVFDGQKTRELIRSALASMSVDENAYTIRPFVA